MRVHGGHRYIKICAILARYIYARMPQINAHAFIYSEPTGLSFVLSFRLYMYVHTLYMHTAKALTSLRCSLSHMESDHNYVPLLGLDESVISRK